MLRIGELSRRVGLSRTTLLYYEGLGLLQSRRLINGYRIYDEEQCRRAVLITRYRELGLGLPQIGELLEQPADPAHQVLRQRLEGLGDEIAERREQQRTLLRLLRVPEGEWPSLDKAHWIRLFRQAGIDEGQMARWHARFEAQAPAAHEAFLRSLAIPPFEIDAIRRWARRQPQEDSPSMTAPLSTPIIRPEIAADLPAIERINQLAFASHPHSNQREARLVAALREAGALSLSLVAEIDGEVVGHIAFSRVTLALAPDAPWFGLGPLAVEPGFQGRGIGQSLVREGLARLGGLGAEACVVLGAPAWYGRFGFRAEPHYRCAFDVPTEYFLWLGLAEDAKRRGPGLVAYHPLFGEV